MLFTGLSASSLFAASIIGLHALICAFFIGISPVGILAEAEHLKLKKSMPDKFARQILIPGLFSGFYLFISNVLIFIMGGYYLKTLSQTLNAQLGPVLKAASPSLAEVSLLPFIIGCILFLLAVAVYFLYAVTWERMKNERGKHMLIGALSFLLSCLGLYFLGVGVKAFSVLFASWPGIPDAGANKPEFFIPPMLVTLLAYAPASGFSLSALWLFVRREKDDYGRDYYNYALKYCARNQVFASAITLLSLVWQGTVSFFPLKELSWANYRLVAWVAATAVFLLAAVLFRTVAADTNPLRRKLSVVCAVAMLWISLGAMFLSSF